MGRAPFRKCKTLCGKGKVKSRGVEQQQSWVWHSTVSAKRSVE